MARSLCTTGSSWRTPLDTSGRSKWGQRTMLSDTHPGTVLAPKLTAFGRLDSGVGRMTVGRAEKQHELPSYDAGVHGDTRARDAAARAGGPLSETQAGHGSRLEAMVDACVIGGYSYQEMATHSGVCFTTVGTTRAGGSGA